MFPSIPQLLVFAAALRVFTRGPTRRSEDSSALDGTAGFTPLQGPPAGIAFRGVLRTGEATHGLSTHQKAF